MAIPTTLESLSATAASNGPAGTDQRTIADDGLRQAFAFMRQMKALATLASATTVTPPSTANVFSVTGNTTIATIASTNSWNGRDIWFIFSGALTITHGSNLLLPGSADIVTATSDAAMFTQRASGQWRCIAYQRADGALGSTVTAGDLTVNGALGVGVTPSGFNFEAQGPSVNSDIARFSGDTTQTRGLELSSFAVGGVNGVGFLWNAPGSPLNGTHAWGSADTENMRLDASGQLLLGMTDATDSAAATTLQVLNGSARCISLTNSTTDAANKVGRISVRHYLNAEEDFSVIGGTNSVNGNTVQIGGGSSTLNAATSVNVYVAEDNTTVTGSLVVTIDSDAVSLQGNGLVVTSDGRVYGDAIHNNAGDVTGEATQHIASGTYTPTLTNGTNVAASTARAGQWTRVGNVVNVSGTLDVDPTAASGTQTILGISLPIASDLTAVNQCAGTAVSTLLAGGVSTSPVEVAAIQGSTANNRAVMYWNAGTTSNVIFSYQFQYLILD